MADNPSVKPEHQDHWTGWCRTDAVSVTSGVPGQSITKTRHNFDITNVAGTDVNMEWEYKHTIWKRFNNGWQDTGEGNVRPVPHDLHFELKDGENLDEDGLPNKLTGQYPHTTCDFFGEEGDRHKLTGYTRLDPQDVDYGEDIKHTVQDEDAIYWKILDGIPVQISQAEAEA